MAVPTHNDVQFKIRIPADLKERVDAAAKANSRSTTAEIVATLEKEYPAPVEADLSNEELQARLERSKDIFAAMNSVISRMMEPGSDPDALEKEFQALQAEVESLFPNPPVRNRLAPPY